MKLIGVIYGFVVPVFVSFVFTGCGGGCATSFKRDGFTFEIALHAMAGGGLARYGWYKSIANHTVIVFTKHPRRRGFASGPFWPVCGRQ